jgi:hypothetical protein
MIVRVKNKLLYGNEYLGVSPEMNEFCGKNIVVKKGVYKSWDRRIKIPCYIQKRAIYGEWYWLPEWVTLTGYLNEEEI